MDKIVVAIDGSGDYTSINDAINLAPAGSCLMLRPGTYKESIHLLKELHICGDGLVEEIILEQENNSCITVDTDASIKGITIKGKGILKGFFSKKKGTNTIVISSGKLLLEDCHLKSQIGHSIEGRNGTSVELNRCNIHNPLFAGLTLEKNNRFLINQCTFDETMEGLVAKGNCKGRISGTAIRAIKYGLVNDSSTITLEDCDIVGGDHAVYVQGGELSLRNSKLHDSQNGIHVKHGSARLNETEVFQFANNGVIISVGGKVELKDSKIYQGKKGIFHSGEKLKAENCEISRQSRIGISVVDAGVTEVSKTHIFENKVGTYFIGSTGFMEDCFFYENPTGLMVAEKSDVKLQSVKFQACGLAVDIDPKSTVTAHKVILFENKEDVNVDAIGRYISEETQEAAATAEITTDNSEIDLEKRAFVILQDINTVLQELQPQLDELLHSKKIEYITHYSLKGICKDLPKYLAHLEKRLNSKPKVSLFTGVREAGTKAAMEGEINKVIKALNKKEPTSEELEPIHQLLVKILQQLRNVD